MSDIPDKHTFQSLYAGQPPWDIGKPQKAFVEIADKISGSVLDAGCGTGDNALYFAERGFTTTFLVKDALTLKEWTFSAFLRNELRQIGASTTTLHFAK